VRTRSGLALDNAAAFSDTGDEEQPNQGGGSAAEHHIEVAAFPQLF
jgi:hypothetical protein